jgi:hypothetical protein
MKIILDIGTSFIKWVLIQENLQGSKKLTYKSIRLELDNGGFSKPEFYDQLRHKLTTIRETIPGLITSLHCLLPSAFFDWKLEAGRLIPVPFDSLLTDMNSILDDCNLEASFLGACLNAEVTAIQKLLPEFEGVLISGGQAEIIYTYIQNSQIQNIVRTNAIITRDLEQYWQTTSKNRAIDSHMLPMGSARQYMRLPAPLQRLFETLLPNLAWQKNILLTGGTFDIYGFCEMLEWRTRSQCAFLARQLGENDPMSPSHSVYTPLYSHFLVA